MDTPDPPLTAEYVADRLAIMQGEKPGRHPEDLPADPRAVERMRPLLAELVRLNCPKPTYTVASFDVDGGVDVQWESNDRWFTLVVGPDGPAQLTTLDERDDELTWELPIDRCAHTIAARAEWAFKPVN